MLSLVLLVNDCTVSRDFYTRNLGFSVAGPSLPGPDGEAIFSAITRDGVTILLDATEPETTAMRDHSKGVTLQLSLPAGADIDQLYERIVAANIPITLEATSRHHGERMFAIVDPDGYTITITGTPLRGSNPSAA